MLAELRITPIGEGSLKEHVAATLAALQQTSLNYRVHSMGTTLEGPLPDILSFVQRAHETLREKSDRVLVELALDDRDDEPGAIDRSLAHLRDAIGEIPLERGAE